MEKLFPDKIQNKHDPTADSKKLWSTLHPIRNFRIFRIIKSHARQPSRNTYVANIPMKPTTACERHVRIKRLNIFHSNLHVINKFSKPMTMLVKTIKLPHCSATDFQNMYVSTAWHHALSCADSKSSEGLKPSETPHCSMYLFSTFCKGSISPSQGYMREESIAYGYFRGHRASIYFIAFTSILF